MKSNDKLGNVQLTIIPGVIDGNEAFLLDADVDENGTLLPHLFDVLVRHPRAGGSNPYYIFELLRLDYPQLDLGYRLQLTDETTVRASGGDG